WPGERLARVHAVVTRRPSLPRHVGRIQSSRPSPAAPGTTRGRHRDDLGRLIACDSTCFYSWCSPCWRARIVRRVHPPSGSTVLEEALSSSAPATSNDG